MIYPIPLKNATAILEIPDIKSTNNVNSNNVNSDNVNSDNQTELIIETETTKTIFTFENFKNFSFFVELGF